VATGIKESLEVLEAVKVLLVDIKAVLKDGKINMDDVGVVFDLLRQLSTLNAGVEGVSQVPGEVMDLDAKEAEQVIAKAMELVAIFRA
jgi:3-deoxy-D-manno-octulosonate 8-phosphate phosphatase KdsC-like HAD superfamily phosphatase